MTELIPVLSRGAHEPDGQFCVMEHISVRAGLEWGDHPSCTHAVLAAAARRINDVLDDGPRQQLLDIEDDLLTAPPRPDFEPRLSIELGIWAAEQVLPIWEAKHPEDQRPRKAIGVAQAWLTNPSAATRDAAAAYAAAAAASADAAAAAAAAADAAAAAAAASAAASADAAAASADAVAVAAAAPVGAAPGIPNSIDFLKGLISKYREVAGAVAMRSEHAAIEGARS